MHVEKSNLLVIAIAFVAILFLGACSEKQGEVDVSDVSAEPDFIPVTADNYIQAETDWNFAAQQAQAPINTWTHNDVVTEENQTIIRSNADVVYSLALVDVSGGATFSIPKRTNGALQMIHYMDENHLTHGVIYAGESVTVTPDDLTGGNYVYILARTKVSDDLEETQSAQRSMVIDAKSSRPYEAKGFKAEEVQKFRGNMIDEVSSGKVAIDGSKAFGKTLDDVEYESFYYASALGWGGLPPAHAQYTAFVKGQGSDASCQTITFPKPNLDYDNGGFFSLTTYNAESWIEGDNFYIGHERMKYNGDGTMTIDFNCDTPHSVTVKKGWNGTFRLYKPVDIEETIKAVNHLMTIDITSDKSSSDVQTAIPEIDSSQWKADPVKYGMTAKEFIQAESRAFISDFISRNGINEWFHFKALANKDDKWVVSPNNDTIYSIVGVNATDGFTLVVPDVGERFVSIHMVDENHMSPFYLYGGGTYEFTRDQFQSDYLALGIRMGTNGTPEDVKHIVEDLQPQYKILNANPADTMVRPDTEKMLKVREAMIVEYDKLPDTFGAMVDHTSEVTDWEKFTYVTAGAWGLSPDHTAMYAPYALDGVKGGKCYTATYPAVPVDAFFSITVYGQDKYLMADHDNIVSSNQKALVNDDGSFDVVYGGMDCKVKGKNFLYTPDDNWSFLMRAYKPDVEKFKGYSMPEINQVK